MQSQVVAVHFKIGVKQDPTQLTWTKLFAIESPVFFKGWRVLLLGCWPYHIQVICWFEQKMNSDVWRSCQNGRGFCRVGALSPLGLRVPQLQIGIASVCILADTTTPNAKKEVTSIEVKSYCTCWRLAMNFLCLLPVTQKLLVQFMSYLSSFGGHVRPFQTHLAL